MSLYQKSNPNLPNYVSMGENQFPIRDTDQQIVTTMNINGEDIKYYDYDIIERGLVSGPGDNKILIPAEQDYGIPTDTKYDPSKDGGATLSFVLDNQSASLEERLDVVNNGRLSDIQVLDFNLPENADFVIHKDNKLTSIKGIVENTSLNEIFFSDVNMDVIQKSIRYGVNQKTEKIISNQPENIIYIIMRSILLQYGNFRVTVEDLSEEVRGLNKRVVDYCVDNISSNVQQYVGYIKTLEKMPVPLDRPAYHNKNNYTYDISNII